MSYNELSLVLNYDLKVIYIVHNNGSFILLNDSSDNKQLTSNRVFNIKEDNHE